MITHMIYTPYVNRKSLHDQQQTVSVFVVSLASDLTQNTPETPVIFLQLLVFPHPSLYVHETKYNCPSHDL